MNDLWFGLQQLFEAVWNLLITLLALATPWLGLAAWIAFWLFAVNWVTLRRVLLQGGWTGLVLIALAAVLVWGVISPPVGGSHYLLGLTVSNFGGKTVYVTALVCLMLFCGSVQLAGFTPRSLSYVGYQPAPVEDDHGHGHEGHGHAGGGHDGHSHVAHATGDDHGHH